MSKQKRSIIPKPIVRFKFKCDLCPRKCRLSSPKKSMPVGCPYDTLKHRFSLPKYTWKRDK